MWTLKVNGVYVDAFNSLSELLRYVETEVDPYEAQWLNIQFRKNWKSKKEKDTWDLASSQRSG